MDEAVCRKRALSLRDLLVETEESALHQIKRFGDRVCLLNFVAPFIRQSVSYGIGCESVIVDDENVSGKTHGHLNWHSNNGRILTMGAGTGGRQGLILNV